MPGTAKRPSREPSVTAARAMALVEQLREEVRFLRGEIRAARRLTLASFGIATAAIAAIATFRFA
jgi:hypothetical protein